MVLKNRPDVAIIFVYVIFRFRARRSKDYEAYTAYMVNNICERLHKRNLEIAVEK